MKMTSDTKNQDHYTQHNIQPIDFISDVCGPSWMAGNIIKYASRYNKKDGVKDIKKAIHYCEMLINVLEGRGPRDYGEEDTLNT